MALGKEIDINNRIFRKTGSKPVLKMQTFLPRMSMANQHVASCYAV